MIKTVKNSQEVIDFAWELSRNCLHSSYPKRDTIKEMKREIKEAISADYENIIAYYNDNVLFGICSYFWICEERYVQTTEFLVSENYELVADELIDYIRNQLPGYELMIGVPYTNTVAIGYFKGKNFECIEASIDTRLYKLKSSMTQRNEQIEKVTDSSFLEYGLFHDKYAIPLQMYYDSRNLKRDIERFRVFVFRQNGKIYGSIFVKIIKDRAEVFGLFVDKQYQCNNIEGILIKEMLKELYNEFGALKEITYFVNEDCINELESALDAGFKIKDKYRCYKCLL